MSLYQYGKGDLMWIRRVYYNKPACEQREVNTKLKAICPLLQNSTISKYQIYKQMDAIVNQPIRVSPKRIPTEPLGRVTKIVKEYDNSKLLYTHSETITKGTENIPRSNVQALIHKFQRLNNK